jgi:hypothetical protein
MIPHSTAMRPLFRTLILFLGLLVPAAAQESDAPPALPGVEEARLLAGDYELRSADGTHTCPVTLQSRAGRTGFPLTFGRKECTPFFAFLGEVISWHPGIAGSIAFLAKDGRVVAEFAEGVGGVYDAIRENDAVYFLANLKFVEPAHTVRVVELLGDWNLSRPGGAPICRITLSDELLAENTFAVRLHPGCDAAIERFGPRTWQLTVGDIVVSAENGDQLRFGRQEDGSWARVPDRPRPLIMTRP